LESPLNTFAHRIFRALAQFNSAYTDYPLGSILAEIVTLATAFEILLDIQKRNKTEELCEKIEYLFAKNQQIKKPTTDKSWKVYWMRQFYRLRNDIVHGKKVSYKDFYWKENPYAGTHQEIAIEVFRLVLMKKLPEGIHKKRSKDTYQADKLDEFLSTKRKFLSNEHNHEDFIKWLTERNRK